VLFRGALLLLPAALLGWSPRVTRAAAAAGVVLFAALHAPFGVLNVAAACIAGAGYAALAVASRSLWPAVLAHGYYNLVLLLSR
jgi:membrane protease YdiL (CAAX protease family)